MEHANRVYLTEVVRIDIPIDGYGTGLATHVIVMVFVEYRIQVVVKVAFIVLVLKLTCRWLFQAYLVNR